MWIVLLVILIGSLIVIGYESGYHKGLEEGMEYAILRWRDKDEKS